MEVRAEGGLGGGLEGGSTWPHELPQVAAQCYSHGQGQGGQCGVALWQEVSSWEGGRGSCLGWRGAGWQDTGEDR